MQITTLLGIVFIFFIPIVTIYKKIDLLRNFLFPTDKDQNKIILPKVSFSISLLTKLLTATMLGVKLYISLYTISYILTNNVVLSLVASFMVLGSLVILLYIFWKLKPTWQDVIIKYSGLTASTILLSILSTFCLIGIYYLVKNFNSFNLYNVKVISKDLIFVLLSTSVSYLLGKYLSLAMLSINKTARKFYSNIFHALANIPTIIYGCLTYFLINGYFPFFYLHNANDHLSFFTKLIICSSIQGLLCSPIIINRFLTGKKVNFITSYFDFLFEVNLFINLLFFITKDGNHLLSNNYLSILIINKDIHTVGVVLLVLYILRFVYVRRHEAL
jgi:hypothetical protein